MLQLGVIFFIYSAISVYSASTNQTTTDSSRDIGTTLSPEGTTPDINDDVSSTEPSSLTTTSTTTSPNPEYIDPRGKYRPKRNCTPPAIDQFPPTLLPRKFREHGGLIIHILIAIFTFLGLAIVCDDYFVASLDRICEGLPYNFLSMVWFFFFVRSFRLVVKQWFFTILIDLELNHIISFLLSVPFRFASQFTIAKLLSIFLFSLCRIEAVAGCGWRHFYGRWKFSAWTWNCYNRCILCKRWYWRQRCHRFGRIQHYVCHFGVCTMLGNGLPFKLVATCARLFLLLCVDHRHAYHYVEWFHLLGKYVLFFSSRKQKNR